jgi:hypothetical protein
MAFLPLGAGFQSNRPAEYAFFLLPRVFAGTCTS